MALLSGKALNNACKKSLCCYKPHPKHGSFKVPNSNPKEYNFREEVPWTPMDIEEIHRYGKQEHYCPYYLNRIRAEKADIVLLPYNYIVDGRIRKRLKIDMRNDVLIIDEAHNISQVIEDASSFKIDTLTFIRALKELYIIKEVFEFPRRLHNGH